MILERIQSNRTAPTPVARTIGLIISKDVAKVVPGFIGVTQVLILTTYDGNTYENYVI